MRKTEVPGIYKESEGVLINRDMDSLERYRKRRELQKKKENQINTLETKVGKLMDDMEEIKSLLKQLTAK